MSKSEMEIRIVYIQTLCIYIILCTNYPNAYLLESYFEKVQTRVQFLLKMVILYPFLQI